MIKGSLEGMVSFVFFFSHIEESKTHEAWKPQAMFAWSIKGSNSASGPHTQLPNPSPMSTFINALCLIGPPIAIGVIV